MLALLLTRLGTVVGPRRPALRAAKRVALPCCGYLQHGFVHTTKFRATPPHFQPASFRRRGTSTAMTPSHW